MGNGSEPRAVPCPYVGSLPFPPHPFGFRRFAHTGLRLPDPEPTHEPHASSFPRLARSFFVLCLVSSPHSLLALLVVPKGRSLPTGFALTLPQPLGTRVTHPLSSRYTSLGSATRFVLRVSLHGPSGPRFTRRSLSLVAPFLATLVLRPSGPRSLVTKGV